MVNPMPDNKSQEPENGKVPEKQWDLPAAIDPHGSLISLREVTNTPGAVLSFASLTGEQQAELVAARIAMQEKFEVSMIGVGKVDKERAIEEVRARSPIGLALIEIESRLMRRMLHNATGSGVEV